MGFWQIFVLGFVTLNFTYFIWIQFFGKTKEGPFLKRLFKAAVAGLILCMFVWGYVFLEGVYIPRFLSFVAAPASFWWILIVSTILVIPLNIVLVQILPNIILNQYDSETKEALAYHGNIISVIALFFKTLEIGATEEYLFRFVLFVALQPVIFALITFTPLAGIASIIPSWLTFGAASLFSKPVFIAALLINLCFAYFHRKTKTSNQMWNRVVYAWILGWILFQAAFFYGIFGVMLIHAALDFIVACPALIVANKKAAEEYWEERYRI